MGGGGEWKLGWEEVGDGGGGVDKGKIKLKGITSALIYIFA